MYNYYKTTLLFTFILSVLFVKAQDHTNNKIEEYLFIEPITHTASSIKVALIDSKGYNVKDEAGNAFVFKNEAHLFNYFGKQGWVYTETIYQTVGNPKGKMYLFKRIIPKEPIEADNNKKSTNQ